ncbi:MAG: hypothetical protein APR63_13865 [Desulfuromonas sp. SDB]|nr:MAG: hypothetical protein APR63_13865 [Desulfuromonas sp. SDB]
MSKKLPLFFSMLLVVLFSFSVIISCSSGEQDVQEDQPQDEQVEEIEEVEEPGIGPGQFIFARTSTTPTHSYDSAVIVEMTEDSVVFEWCDNYAKGEDGRTYPNSSEYFHAAEPATEGIEVGTSVMIAPKGTSFVYYIGEVTEIGEGQYIVDYMIPGYDQQKVDTCTDLSRMFVIVGE